MNLFDIEPQYWPDERIPRTFKNGDGSVLSMEDTFEIVTSIITEHKVEIVELPEEELTLFITVDDDDFSAFTTFMQMVQRVYPDIDLTPFYNLDEIMECTYIAEDDKSLISFNILMKQLLGY